MSIVVSPYNPVQQSGCRAKNPPDMVIASRAPNSTDYGYFIGTLWLYSGDSLYVLLATTISPTSKSASWTSLGGGSSQLSQLTGDSGTAIPSGGSIKVGGGTTGLTTTGSGAQVVLGGLLGVPNGGTGLNTLTQYSVLCGAGTSPLQPITNGTAGQVLQSFVGGYPGFFALGVNSGLTAHGVLLGEGNSAIAATAVGATGTALMGNTGADPTFTGSPSFSGSVTAATSVTAGSSVSAGTQITAGTGLTVTNGNLGLNTAGNKVNIAVGTDASVGISNAMTTGAVTVNTTAVTTNSLIFVCPSALGTVTAPQAGYVSSRVPGTSFVITSADATDTSTWNYWIIN